MPFAGNFGARRITGGNGKMDVKPMTMNNCIGKNLSKW